MLKKHIAALAMRYNPGLFHDKPLGAPTYVKLIYLPVAVQGDCVRVYARTAYQEVIRPTTGSQDALMHCGIAHYLSPPEGSSTIDTNH